MLYNISIVSFTKKNRIGRENGDYSENEKEKALCREIGEVRELMDKRRQRD